VARLDPGCVVVALLNFNLAGPRPRPLRQSRRRTRAIVEAPFAEIAPKPSPICRSTSGATAATKKRTASISRSRTLSGAPLDDGERRATTLADRALLIFTSGTTGLPKAAPVSHYRVVAWSHWFAGLADMRADDRLYDCLPLATASAASPRSAAALVNGGSVVIAEKFSASRFSGATSRAGTARSFSTLANSAATSSRAGVSRREAPSIAPCLRQRTFGRRMAHFRRAFRRGPDPRILRLTEGTLTLYNVDGKVARIGRQPPFLAARRRHRIGALRLRERTPGAGQMVFAPAAPSMNPAKRLAASAASRPALRGLYTEPAETEKKILRDVFAPGDAWNAHRRPDAPRP